MNNDLFKYAVALTGGIATGKSTVCKLLKLKGFDVIDADNIAHELLDANSFKIAELFGEEFVENKKVLRKKLGKLIFADEQMKLKLEALIHPLIKDEIYKQAARLEKQKKTYFIDIPLFFEKMHYPIPKSLLVYTPRSIQIQRLEKRDGISKEEAQLKISNQMDIEEKKALASFIIDNSLDLENLENEVKKIIKEVL